MLLRVRCGRDRSNVAARPWKTTDPIEVLRTGLLPIGRQLSGLVSLRCDSRAATLMLSFTEVPGSVSKDQQLTSC